MTEQDPTGFLTTTYTVETIHQTTAGSSMASSTSLGVDFYFRCAVLVIGVVGTAANALILYAMVASGEHKKRVLIFNQNALDFASCFFLVVTYAFKLCNVYLTGTSGYWLCVTLRGESLFWSPVLGSTLNLASVTIERYLKIVHNVRSKIWLRNWVIYMASAFAWIGSATVVVGVAISTAFVVDGVCYANVFRENSEAQLAFGIWYFMSFEVVILAIFIFCYWRILIVIRRQAKVMASHNEAGPNTSQARQLTKNQSNVMKTMSIVTAFFTVSWTPVNVHFLVQINPLNASLFRMTYYPLLFIAFLYICTNPFIYAIKFEPVKRVLLGLIPWKKNSVQPSENI